MFLEKDLIIFITYLENSNIILNLYINIISTIFFLINSNF